MANGQVDLAIVGGEVPTDLQDSLEILPYAEDELALILPVSHPLSKLPSVHKEELYNLQFIALDSQSTIRKVIDRVLGRCDIDTRRLTLEMELNSIEAIKNAVQSGLGAAFVSVSAIEKELEMGVLHRATLEEVVVKRTLNLIYNPNRYRSKAAEAFITEILPLFSNQELDPKLLEPIPRVKANSKGKDPPSGGNSRDGCQVRGRIPGRFRRFGLIRLRSSLDEAGLPQELLQKRQNKKYNSESSW